MAFLSDHFGDINELRGRPEGMEEKTHKFDSRILSIS